MSLSRINHSSTSSNGLVWMIWVQIICPYYIEWECGLSTVTTASPVLQWSWGKANWEGYRKEVDRMVEEVSGEAESWSVSRLSTFLVDCMLSAAKSFVGKAKTKSNGKSWMTREVREAVKRRNSLRRTISANREE